MTRSPLSATLAIAVGLSTLLAASPPLDPPEPNPLPARGLPDVSVLEDGRTIERRAARADDHRYRITLAAGEYVRVVVEQRGIDVLAQTRGRDGAVIAEFQDDVRPRGEEQIGLVADARGTYTIAIRAARGAVAPGAYTIRVAARRAATGADRSLQEARRLRTLAARLDTDGRFDDARLLLERALTVTEAVQGPNDAQVAAAAVQLAGVCRRLPTDGRSESLYLRGIDIFDRTLGADHPTTAIARGQLAVLYQHEGERRKADAILRQTLDVLERTLGVENPWYVSALLTLGNLLDGGADLDGERAVIERALAITERIDDANSVQYAALLNNLGEVYRQKEDYARAQELFQRSLTLGERLLGPDNYSVATPLQNLAIVARERKDYPTAIADNMRALSIRERMVGRDHPDVAHILINLANIYRATGDYPRALETHLRALHIWENAVGPYQQATLLAAGNIAKTYAAADDVPNAIAYQRRADTILEKQLALNLAVGSERQKLTFVRAVSERTDRTISLHLDGAPGDPGAAALAALVLLQRKGRVQDAMIDARAAVRSHVAEQEDRDLLDRLNETTAQLARLALNAPDRARAEDRLQALARLEAKKEQLESTLSDHSAEFRAHAQPVGLEAVQAALPDDAALLEFAVFRPFDPKAERNAEAYGAAHYAAYVVRKGVAPVGVDLGSAAALDRAIDALRDALRTPASTDVQAWARVVDERVMQPLRASVGDATRLLISPDGTLNLVPFEALVDREGRYLIERYATSYLTSGRDLLRMQVPRASRSEPVVIANPLFGEPPAAATTGVVRPVHTAGAGRSAATADGLSTVYFAPLAASAEEAHAIKGLFPDATLLTGAGATKAVLQQVQAPLLLHIASHGFFLDDVDSAAGGNPLLRSGLALAGANLTRDGRGILTALEASGLDLWGTKLVTLSACDTGIGEVRNGEGVYGLRRAFVLAGAETLVMSLWPLSDSIARDAMVAYYTGLRAGLGRGDALREAKLAMLKRPNRRHPYYWAAFIQSGEWADLAGRRRD